MKLLLYILLLLCSCGIGKQLAAQEESSWCVPYTKYKAQLLAAGQNITAAADLNLLICWEVNDGDYPIYDCLWVRATDAVANALVNIAKPGTNTGILEGSPVPTFTAYVGVQGDGSQSYIYDNYNAYTQGVNFTAASNSYGCYLQNATQQGNYSDMGCSAAGFAIATFMLNNFSSGQIYCYDNENGNLTAGSIATTTGTAGDYVINRISNTSETFYINGSSFTPSGFGAAVTNVNQVVFTCCANIGGSAQRYTTHVIAISFYAGAGINYVQQSKNFSAYMKIVP